MKGLANACDHLLEILLKAATYIGGTCIFLIAFFVVYEIVMRGVFHSPTEWVLEVSVYLMLAAGFLGLAVAQSTGANIQVDLFTGMMSSRVKLIARVVTTCLCIVFCLVFIDQGTDMVMTSYEFDRTSPSTLRFPLFIPQMFMVFGGVLLLAQFCREIIMDARKLAGCDKKK